VTGYSPAPAPPWHKVIATTVRLWWERRVGHSRRTPVVLGLAVLVLAVALVAVSAVAVNLAGDHHAPPAQAQPARRAHLAQPVASPPLPDAVEAAAASRQLAAAWVVSQVGHDVIVACDPLMCGVLGQRGFPAADLMPIEPGTGDPLGSGIVISTMAVRSQLGTRLTSVYAPQVLASFGSGQGLVQVLATAPDGAAAYRSAEQSDTQARASAGRQLLGNKNVHAVPLAAQQLAAGQVDSRLLITIAALAARYQVYIRVFGGAGPGSDPGVPLRYLTITATSRPYLRNVLSFLQAQRPPLLALTAVGRAGRVTVIHIGFTAPSPIGLLGQS
jgi:hypothetical protein